MQTEYCNLKDYRLLCKPERSQYDENEIKL